MSETVAANPPPETATVEVTMPVTGSEQEVRVTAWLKQPGDRVSDGEVLCLVAWGDSSAEIASPAAGVMRMVTVASGDRVAVGATLAVIDLRVSTAGGRFQG